MLHTLLPSPCLCACDFLCNHFWAYTCPKTNCERNDKSQMHVHLSLWQRRMVFKFVQQVVNK